MNTSLKLMLSDALVLLHSNFMIGIVFNNCIARAYFKKYSTYAKLAPVFSVWGRRRAPITNN